MRQFALAFLAGLVSALGFQPIGLWPATLAAFALLLWLIDDAPRMRAALARGWGFGVGQFVLGLNWIATAFTYQAAMPAWLGWVAVVLLSLYLAVYPAVAAGLAWRWGRGHPATLALVLAAAWIVTEWLRATLFTGFAWNPVGVVLVGLDTATASRWIGTYGLSAMVVIGGGAAHWLATHRWASHPLSDLWRTPTLAFGILILAAWFAVPAAQRAIGMGLSISPPGTGALARIVQPNIGQNSKWDPAYERENFLRHARLTGLPRHEPRLVLWPEAATPELLTINPSARRRLAALIGPRDVLLLGGVDYIFDPRSGRPVAARNSLFVLDGMARLRGRYDKAHLVPYGEYLPMRPLLSTIGLSRLAPGDLDFHPGPGPRTIELPGFGRAGIQVCYEIIFSGQVVDPANRPDFIFNPSNDAWFGAWGPPQHLAQARLRAIEEGLPVVRATPTGISAVIRTDGALAASVPLGTAGTIDARLPRAAAPTLFARFGNLLPFAFALLLIAAAIAVRRKAR